MPDNTSVILEGVPETLLITLYIRAQETQRPDALLKDERAVALLSRLGHDFSRFEQVRMDEDDKVGVILRNREFDTRARDFLTRHPQAVVVHIGCGLDTRFERVDNSQVEWYDLDLPEVIELRRKFIGGEEGRYHLLACSVFDPEWLERLSVLHHRPFLFMAEGVFMYCEEGQVRSFVQSLLQRFPGCELVFDAFNPFIVFMNNLRMSLSRVSARYHWGLKRARDIENWGEGIRFLDEWFILDSPEPRLDHIRWIRQFPFLAKVMGIFHYRLGEQAHSF